MTEQPTTPIADDEINLLDLLLVLARRWRMILAITLLAALASAAVAMLLPNRYQATAKVIALQRQTIQPISASLAGAAPVVGAPKPQLQQTNVPILQDILQTGPIMQTLAKQFQFPSLTAFKSQYKIKTDKNGAVEVIAEDADPKRAAAIANAAVAELGRAAYALNLVSSPEVTDERDLEKLDSSVTTAIKLLEPASVPTEKSKPKRALIVVLAGVSALFVAVMLAFMLEAISHLQPDDRRRWEEIKAALKGR